MTHEEKILQTEYCPRFDELRKNRMVVSFYKYGPLIENYKNEKCMDAIGNLKARIEAYEKTGNTEFLVDAANFCMLEFMHPQKEGAYFAGTDSGACKTIGFGVNEVKREMGLL